MFVSSLHVTAIHSQQGITGVTHMTGAEWADLALKVIILVWGMVWGVGVREDGTVVLHLCALSVYVCFCLSLSHLSLCLTVSLSQSLSLSPPLSLSLVCVLAFILG